MISRANLPPQWSGSKKRLAQHSSPYFISRSMLPSRMHGPFFRFLPKAPSFGDGKQGKCGHTCKFRLFSGQFVPKNLVASHGANAPVPCFCHLPYFQADGQCLLSRLRPRAYRSVPAGIQRKAFSSPPQVCGVFLLVRPC